MGGYLTDRFGRRRVLTYSILLYAFATFASGFATSLPMFLVLRCLTLIGVCVEFVAAIAWLAELFPQPEQRERVLGYTQAFSSFGGMTVIGRLSALKPLHCRSCRPCRCPSSLPARSARWPTATPLGGTRCSPA